MIYIAISVLCSVAVSVLLKLMPGWRVDVRQAIAGGYLVAALLCLGWLGSSPVSLVTSFSGPAWQLFLLLGVLLPSMFLVLARSVEHVGVVRTDAAQRLSLVIPLLAAFTLFGEAWSWHKGVGIIAGLLAIALIVMRREEVSTESSTGRRWPWPLVVFLGMGLIDVLFKRVAQLSRVPFVDVLFAVFALAFVLSALYVAWLVATRRAYFAWRHAGMALALGVLNFGNIVFYIEAHRHLARNPALVFSAMNIGVIVLATLVGMVAFREHVGRWNRFGLALAVVAVLVLATS